MPNTPNSTRRKRTSAIPLALASLGACLIATPTSAQLSNVANATPTASAASGTPIATPPATARDAEYAALARDVDAMGREFGLVKRVVKLVTPAVVHIEAKPLPTHRSLRNIEEAGSGVIVQFGSRFYVLTNRHVVRHSLPESLDVKTNTDRIEVHLADGRVLNPTRVWMDSETDVAALAIDADNLAPAKLGDSDAIEIGDFVLAIGSPFGLSQSVTRGIVSAKGRHNLDLGDDELKWQNFIQTDAAINPGNSGGPLVDLNGHLVGINASIQSPQAQSGGEAGSVGLGFAIPIDAVLPVIEQMEKGETPTHARLGISVENVALGAGALVADGAQINDVSTGSAAASAGLANGDVITKVDDTLITDADGLVATVRSYRPGDEVTVTYTRDGKEDTVTLTLDSDASATNS